MNTDFKSFEEFLNWRHLPISLLADRCLDVKENLEFWRRTRVYTALLSIVQDVACYGDNAKLVNDFVVAVRAKETELDALYSASKAELDALLAKAREREKRVMQDEEAFAQRWYSCSRSYFSGKYMKYVSSIDDLKADTWTEYDNKYIIKVIEDANYDWSYYAKSYKHPKKTVNFRYIRIYKHGTGKNAGHVVVAKEIEIESFRQNNILQAIADYFKIAKPARNKMQTNSFYEIKKINKNLFCQKFGKQVVGYVAVDNDIYYHSRRKSGATDGLSRKIELLKEQEEKATKTKFTSFLLHEKFGFCRQGMREFVESAGLDINKEYSLEELKDAVKRANKNVVQKYKKELKAINVL